MKISKARLQQIIKEEVEAHIKREGSLLELDAKDLQNLLKESGKYEDLNPQEKKLYDIAPADYDIIVDPGTGKTRLDKKGVEDPNIRYLEKDRFDENIEEGLEGVISLIKDRGAEGAVRALKGKKEIDNPWALVNAALTKMGRKGLSRSDESMKTAEDQLHDPSSKAVVKPKDKIRVELKTC